MAISTAPAVEPAMMERRGEGFSFLGSLVVVVSFVLDVVPMVAGGILILSGLERESTAIACDDGYVVKVKSVDVIVRRTVPQICHRPQTCHFTSDSREYRNLAITAYFTLSNLSV